MLAQRGPWRDDDVPWASLDFGRLPPWLRTGAVDLFTQIHYGELAALLCAARLVQEVPDLDAKLFCATMVADEGRHVVWFTRLLDRLGGPGIVRPMVVDLMQEIYEAPHLEQLVAGMQFVIEGVAHALMTEGAKMLQSLSALSTMDDGWHEFPEVLAGWMSQTVVADENRHVAFGSTMLEHLVPALSAERRAALEGALEGWGRRMQASADDPDVFTAIGLDWPRLARRCAFEVNGRLAKCGLDYRLTWSA